MVFCNEKKQLDNIRKNSVTILILIDGFLQSNATYFNMYVGVESHNPYFNRWFSAIKKWLNTDVLPYSSQSLF